MSSMDGPSQLRAEYDKREFFSMSDRITWIFSFIYYYLTSDFDRIRFKKAIEIADEAVRTGVAINDPSRNN